MARLQDGDDDDHDDDDDDNDDDEYLLSTEMVMGRISLSFDFCKVLDIVQMGEGGRV